MAKTIMEHSMRRIEALQSISTVMFLAFCYFDSTEDYINNRPSNLPAPQSFLIAISMLGLVMASTYYRNQFRENPSLSNRITSFVAAICVLMAWQENLAFTATAARRQSSADMTLATIINIVINLYILGNCIADCRSCRSRQDNAYQTVETMQGSTAIADRTANTTSDTNHAAV
jgi:hypothetical protein